MKQLTLTLALFALGTAFSQQISFLNYSFPNDLDPLQTDVLVDGDERVSTGLLFNSAIGKNDVWLTVYDANDVLWSKAVMYPDVFVTSAEIAALNNSTDLVLCTRGSFEALPCMILHRISRETGAVVWTRKFDIEDDFTSFYVEKNGIHVTEDDEILATCTTTEYIQAAQFDSNGNLLFTRRINNIGQNSGNNPGFTFRPASDGGYIGTFRKDSNPTILKLNADLSVQWGKIWFIEDYAHPMSVIERANGNFLVAGFTNTLDFMAEVGPAGELLHYWRFPDDVYGIDRVYELADGSIMAAGSGFYYLIDLATGSADRYSGYVNYAFELTGEGTLGYTYNDLQQPDNFMVATGFDPQHPGCFLGRWTTNLQATEIAVPGSQVDDIAFFLYDSGTLSAYTPTLVDHPFAVSGCSLGTDENTALQLHIFPNPVQGGSQLFIEGTTGTGTLRLTDISGKEVAVFTIDGATASVDLPALGNGVYFARFANGNGVMSNPKKLVVE